MRVVLDTNVFISGIFWNGNYCSQLIDKWKNKEIDLVSSIEIIEELTKTLINFKIPMPKDMIEEWKFLILKNSIIVESSSKIEAIKDDPDDNKFLEVAVDGKAELIVSQDKHLLNLKEYRGIKIVKPEEALSLI
ncbi:MAG: putative toxin-antitoxin system toxin component, PIN family [Nanoarchaeota archaeon]